MTERGLALMRLQLSGVIGDLDDLADELEREAYGRDNSNGDALRMVADSITDALIGPLYDARKALNKVVATE